MTRHYAVQTCDDTDDFFDKLNTFLVTTVGWTLHDDQMAASPYPYRVYRSPGENGKGYRYLYLLRRSDTRIQVNGWRYWDETTQTGYYRLGRTTAFIDGIPTQMTEFVSFFFGDLDNLVVVQKWNDEYRCICPVWKDETLYPTDIALTTALSESGSDVEIAVDDDSFFVEGERYEIVNTNDATGASEMVEVTEVGTGTITVASLANDHPTGAMVGKRPVPFIFQTYSSGSAAGCYMWRPGEGSTSVYPFQAIPTDNAVPDIVDGKTQLWPCFFSEHNAPQVWGPMSGVFLVPGTGLSSEDIITIDGVEYVYFVPTASPHSTSLHPLAVLKG